MPPKRRRSSSLGRRSSNAQRVRLQRLNESAEQTRIRRENSASQMAVARNNETEEEARVRREADAARYATLVRRQRNGPMFLKAKQYDPSQPIISNIGEMNIVCSE